MKILTALIPSCGVKCTKLIIFPSVFLKINIMCEASFTWHNILTDRRNLVYLAPISYTPMLLFRDMSLSGRYNYAENNVTHV